MDHDDHDFDLTTRLAALEARAPAAVRPPTLRGRTRGRRFAVSMAMGPALALMLVAATAATGAVVVSNMVRGYPGIQNPGQPMAGISMECMSPPEAAAVLAAHGFTQVDWQVESERPIKPEGGKGGTSVHQSTPPEHGYVVPGSLLDDGSVIMVVDQRAGATGTGACYGQPMP